MFAGQSQKKHTLRVSSASLCASHCDKKDAVSNQRKADQTRRHRFIEAVQVRGSEEVRQHNIGDGKDCEGRKLGDVSEIVFRR